MYMYLLQINCALVLNCLGALYMYWQEVMECGWVRGLKREEGSLKKNEVLESVL